MKMEENMALDSTKQKKFDKSIKGIKKLIKKKDTQSESTQGTDEKVKTGRVGKKKRPKRGLVYLSHIPHGFYENAMTEYFKQFGVVTNARVIKSKRTGRSKGFAFVEFKEPAVAQIVADTMNNYLMGKRLIKAAYIPPEKQKRKAFRRHWNAVNNPGNNLRIKMKKAHNENKDEKGELERAKKFLSNINNMKKKLKKLGINYDFFMPVDVPEALVKKIEIKTEIEDIKVIPQEEIEHANVKHKNKVLKDTKSKTSNKMEIKKEQGIKTKNNKNKQDKKTMKQDEADKIIQIQKKQSLKDQSITPLDEFIKVNNSDDDDSESSLEFDSDEYEKMLEDESDSDLFDNTNASDDTDEDEDSNESEEELPKQKGPKSIKPGVDPVSFKPLNKNAAKKINKKIQEPQHQQVKRKVQQKDTASIPAEGKKPKFEKQSKQKSRNKQFKVKK